MTNREISKILSLTARLMELHGMNEFRVRSTQSAAFNIGRMEVQLETTGAEELESVKGIGKGISKKILDIISTGTHTELDELLESTPAGVVEMMDIKGIGPKKVAVLWKELGIESPGELLYACNENRLTSLKGFGEKTQDLIKKAIEFSIANRNLYHYASLEELAHQVKEILKALPGVEKISFTGDLRRKCEILSAVEMLVATNNGEGIYEKVSSHELFSRYSSSLVDGVINLAADDEPAIVIHLCKPDDFITFLIRTTGSAAHLEKLAKAGFNSDAVNNNVSSEEEIYISLGLSFIEPELREGGDEIDLAGANKLPQLIRYADLKGCLHNHSVYSDGSNSIEEMAKECIRLGYQYFGICDHSKSAFYANGMQVDRVLKQHDEIDRLNSELAPFKIFKGIESDILPDGALDYEDNILEKFDFVVASVHSGLKMTKEKATERLLTAIANPFTTILGHPTGRLLLAREGYPIDHKKVIDSCAVRGVVIELNAHPYRLDLDWRWIRYATEAGVKISINPDAHNLAGIRDMYYGVCVARKGMLSPGDTFNAMNPEEVTDWFLSKKKRSKTG